MVQFSQEDLKTVPGLERTLRQFQKALRDAIRPSTRGDLDLDVAALARELAPFMSKELTATGSAPLNLQSLIPTTGGAAFMTGTHSQRIGTADPGLAGLGKGFYETDRHYIYIVSSVGGSLDWVFAAGVSVGAEADMWVDLATNDAGALYYASDTEDFFIWDGSEWDEIGSDEFPLVIDTVALTGQTAAIAATAFDDSYTVGTYRVNYYLETTTADGAAGDVTVTISWTDDAGMTAVSSATLPLTALGRTSGVFFVQEGDASGIGALVTRGWLFGSKYITTAGFVVPAAASLGAGITYETSIGGVIGTAEYALFMSLERMSVA